MLYTLFKNLLFRPVIKFLYGARVENEANIPATGGVILASNHLDAGDTVVLLESMKMEIPVLLEAPGTVRAVKVAPGDVVQEGDVLVEVVLT